jgi:2',3'-cyclic-nucleotide 2'-phosphodiesterase
VKILFIADAFATPGRRVIELHVPRLRAEREIGFVVANGENLADGAGITSRLARRLHGAGVDVITLGNHAFRQREVYPHLGMDARIVRPANYPSTAPGKGWCVARAADGTPVAVINLLGKLFLDPAVSPFAVAEDLVREAGREAALVLVDFHAEATSEKVAMGRFLDGRVTAVIGTHTHVQTSDAHVLSGGTAYITDAGMTGPHDSVIGVRTDLILRRFTTQMPVRFEPAEGGVRLEGVVIECDGDGRASSIEAIRIDE